MSDYPYAERFEVNRSIPDVGRDRKEVLDELRQMALDLDVKMVPCQMSMDVMEIGKEDLIDEVDDVVGAATMLAEAQESKVQYFI